jgi:DNA-directed RNA polymerase specialized sigma24 family protein
VAGDVEAGRGPATQRTGPAFLAARELAMQARRRRERLIVQTRNSEVDLLLGGLTPALGRLLTDLTRVQRAVARLILVEGLRQVEVAHRLRIRPPTVSVAADRANLREIAGLLETARRLFADGSPSVGGQR